MMNKKEIAEKIIIALTTGESMSTILLKVQLLASLLGFPQRVEVRDDKSHTSGTKEYMVAEPSIKYKSTNIRF